MKLIVIEPDIVVGEDIVACLESHFSPKATLVRTSLVGAKDDLPHLGDGDLLVVSTTLEDLRDSAILSDMPNSTFSMLILNTDDRAKPRPNDPWHRIPKPFSERMLVQGAHAALEKRSMLAGSS